MRGHMPVLVLRAFAVGRQRQAGRVEGPGKMKAGAERWMNGLAPAQCAQGYRQTAMAIANASGVTTRPIRTQALYTSALLRNMKNWTTIHIHTANPTATLIRSLGAS